MSMSVQVTRVETKESVKMALDCFTAFVDLDTLVHYVKSTLTNVCQSHVITVDTALTESILSFVNVQKVSMT